MMKKFYNWLFKKFGGKIRLIEMTEERERKILEDMRKIEGIYDYWELQKQAGYQLYGKSDDKTFLGWSKLAEHILINLKKIELKPEETKDISDGYDSILN